MNHHRRRPGIGPGGRAVGIAALAGQPIPAGRQDSQGVGAALPEGARIVVTHLAGHLGQYPIQQFGIFAVAVIVGYKAADIYLSNLISKRSDAIRKGLPDALDLLVKHVRHALPDLSVSADEVAVDRHVFGQVGHRRGFALRDRARAVHDVLRQVLHGLPQLF